MKRIYLFCSILIFTTTVFAQSIGDTITVKVFDYKSITRDTMAAFPNNPSLTYEKVIMKYGMRCKDGLVSPPISGQTNIGCGEWDYSCNTYVTDSTKADSISKSIYKYQIIPNTSTSNTYSTTPTWVGKPNIQKSVNLQSVVSEDTAKIGNGLISNSQLIQSAGTGGKSYLLFTQAELVAAGLTAGSIDGFSFKNLGGNALLKKMKVKMKSSSLSNLSTIDTAVFNSMSEVFYHDFNCTNGWNRVQFYNAFNWNGTSNIIIEISYKGQVGNAAVVIESDSSTFVNSLSVANDISFNLFPNNYIETPTYFGIQGSSPRTIEAWIKTTVKGKEIASWGINNSSAKFSFRTENSGALRLEVNGAFVVGTADVCDGNWHHVALVYAGGNISNVKFIVDGETDVNSSVSNTVLNTGNSLAFQISKGFHNRYFDGEIDDMRIWSAVVLPANVKKWRYRKVDATHPNFSNLDLNYTIRSNNDTIVDESVNNHKGYFNYSPSFKSLSDSEHFKEFKMLASRPNIAFYSGTYTQTVSNDTVIDTTFNSPYQLIDRVIFPKVGTIYSDSIAETFSNLYPLNNVLYDLNNVIVSQTASANQQTINNSVLSYQDRSASKIELMSFVTPYGINLDLGMEGKAWYFDVTDFLPVLKGNKRINMQWGGEKQEEMDIQFMFIVGTPPRDVVDIQQIWKVERKSYVDITSDAVFEPRTVKLKPTASEFKLRSAITGHGQQGEFIPRNHFLKVNTSNTFNWQVWKECAENPVFPQGGTWIYDRAGWCPGMATDVKEIDITSLVSGNTVNVDYGVSTASGTSDYIVNNQLVSYGSANFSLDARIIKVIRPSNEIEHGRSNPICDNPKIILQNSGSNFITSATIDYWVNNNQVETFNWSGLLYFMEDEEIELPTPASFWNNVSGSNNTFKAVITSVNGVADMYAYNDSMKTTFEAVDVLPNNFVFQFRSNGAGYESSYDIRDSSGNVVYQRGAMSNNTLHSDTFNLGIGCYSLNIYDTDDDGISFFANSDGNGTMQIRSANGNKTLQPNFGKSLNYNFSITTPLGLDELKVAQNISLYPNPTKNTITIEGSGLKSGIWKIYNNQGVLVKEGNYTVSQNFMKEQIHLSDMAEGIYYINFNAENAAVSKMFMLIK